MRIQAITRFAFLFFVGVLQYVGAQNKNKEAINQNNSSDLNVQAEIDWEEFNHRKMILYHTPQEKARFENTSLLEYSKYIDEVNTKRAEMAETFMQKYPNSQHYGEVLRWYLSTYFMPLFIPNKLDDEKMKFLSKFSGPNRYGKGVEPFYRALPIDTLEMEKWKQKGNLFVDRFLNSNASLEEKLKIEQGIVGRDALLLENSYLGIQKKSTEVDFWNRVDRQLWEPVYSSVKSLIFKYPNLDGTRFIVRQFVNFVVTASRNPSLKKYYWERFYHITDTNNLESNSPGLKAVHDMAGEQLEIMGVKKETLLDKPLEMAFTDMDGTYIDLEKMRGKVVLLDFWSTSCAPCIREMPHIKELYDKYNKDGFEVIGIASNGDDAKQNIKKLMDKVKAHWPQLLDKGKNVTVSYNDLFQITSFPTVWLLDKEGNVVDQEARGSRLEPLIRKYLGLDK